MSESSCLRCGTPVKTDANSYGTLCVHCHENPPSFNLCRSAMLYLETADILFKAFKYRKNWRLSGYLSEILLEHYQEHFEKFQHDLILYVPSHPLKNFRRGYNQSYLLACELSKKTGIPMEIELVKKVRKTESQATLNREERQKNLVGVFAVDGMRGSRLTGKRILIVDDVVTTGATVEEICGLMKAFKPALIHVLTAARTPLAYQ